MATLILGILPSGAVSFAEYASHSTLIEQARQECAARSSGPQYASTSTRRPQRS